MEITQLCNILVNITKNADQVGKLGDLLEMLEHTFVSVFRAGEVEASKHVVRRPKKKEEDGNTKKKDDSDGSEEEEEEEGFAPVTGSSFTPAMEEEKMALALSVCQFHQSGGRCAEGKQLFSSAQYIPHAALFIDALLKSLSGNSKLWFRSLQLSCLQACGAILEVIGTNNVRQCMPGVISSLTRYISRSHLGKDAGAVRREALHLLATCIVEGLRRPDRQKENPLEAKWLQGTLDRLAGVMHRVLKPSFIVKGVTEYHSCQVYREMIVRVLLTDGVGQFLTVTDGTCHPLVQELLIAYGIADNVMHLHQLEPVREETNDEPTTLGASFFTRQDFTPVYKAALTELSGVELIHLSTFVLRQPSLRTAIVTTESATGLDQDNTCVRLVGRIVRYVGAAVPQEDLHTHRAPRPFPIGVIDECIECMAHALSELPSEESEETSVGEHITNLVLDTWEEVLNDWDAYPIHPAALYVIPRLVVWQFKVVPAWWVPTDAQHAVYPQPSDLVTAGVLEQLWSLCGAPHLWNIAEDEDLCSYQQIKHRQTVAAIVLRVLSITVSDVIADATKEEEDAYSLHRFNALLLYIVMEKATVPGMVHDAAVDCLAQIGVASHQSDLFSFYLDISHVLVDEASRAMQVESLRYSAASVLRGAMDYIATHIQQRGKAAEGTVRGSSWFSGSTQLPPLVRERMNITHVRKMVGDTMSDPSFSDRVTKVAAFVTSVIQAAVTGLQTAHREHHTAGVTAALVLLRDCFDVAMYLNFCTPQAPLDEDQERQTTSANPRVALLQQACVNAIQDTLFLSSVASSPAATTMIRTVIHGLTAFLTSTEAVEWMRKEVDKMQEIVSAARAARKEGKSSSVMPVEDEEEEEEEIPLPLPVGELPWTDDSCIVLPRSHLKTVYRVYLSFSSMLREPLVAHLSSNGKRRPEEKRLMERIPITPAVPTAMEGLLALLQLAEDFLIHRTVQEVVPVVLVWYERAGLPRLPTATEERLKGSVVRFLQALLPMTARYGGTLESELLQRAAVWVNIQKGTSSAKVEEVQESV